jgi:geranylgeranyl diphosphate synthase type II
MARSYQISVFQQINSYLLMFNLKIYLAEQQRRIDKALEACLDHAEPEPRIVAAMRHSLMAGGKRLRPVLCLAAAEAVGNPVSRGPLMAAACALEMVHTYSLIHDDLPAMDDDAVRRGRPTCHVAFDEATAILAGDALLTLAFEVLSAPEAAAGMAPERWRPVVHELARAAGHRGMIEGQMRDIIAENTVLTLDALEALHRLKTGALIRAAVRMGALLAGASETALDALDAYARHLGLAFQVADDILNVKGDPDLMGKAAGTDAARGKNTYPALLGLEASEALAVRLKNRALQALLSFGTTAEPLRAIAAYAVGRKR